MTRDSWHRPGDKEETSKQSKQEGRLLHNRFKVLSLLGRGGIGTVYKAKDTQIGAIVAVKLIDASLRHQPDSAARLNREIRVAFSIDSDYVTSLYSIFTDDDHIGLVLEFVDGKSLYSLIEEKRIFSLQEVSHIGRQMALGVKALHDAKIIHRDLKLENIILGTNGIAKITDFGISLLDSVLPQDDPEKEASLDRVRRPTRASQIVGTIHYLSPEYLKLRITDTRMDIYALGVVLYEIITGEFPYTFNSPIDLVEKKIHSDPPPPSYLRRDCPKWLDDIVMRAMCRNPDNRYQDAGQIAEAFAAQLLLGTQVFSEPLVKRSWLARLFRR